MVRQHTTTVDTLPPGPYGINLLSFPYDLNRTGTPTCVHMHDAFQRTTHAKPLFVSDASGRQTSKNGSDLRLRTEHVLLHIGFWSLKYMTPQTYHVQV